MPALTAMGNGDMVESMDKGIKQMHNFLSVEFDRVRMLEPFVDLRKLRKWDEIQALLNDDLMTDAELVKIYDAVCAERSTSHLDRMAFIELNYRIDELFHEGDDHDSFFDSSDSDEEVEDEELKDTFPVFMDPWSARTPINGLLERHHRMRLVAFFEEHAAGDPPMMRYKHFRSWRGLTEMMQHSELDVEEVLQDVWKEALQYQAEQRIAKVQQQDMDDLPSTSITLDVFLRAIFRIEGILEDVQEETAHLHRSKDGAAFLRSSFEDLAEGNKCMSFSQLKASNGIQAMLNGGVLTEQRLQQAWGALPKHRFKPAIPASSGKKGAALEAAMQAQLPIEGIDAGAFVMLIQGLEGELDGTDDEGGPFDSDEEEDSDSE